jgi:hypothetical protein
LRRRTDAEGRKWDVDQKDMAKTMVFDTMIDDYHDFDGK